MFYGPYPDHNSGDTVPLDYAQECILLLIIDVLIIPHYFYGWSEFLRRRVFTVEPGNPTPPTRALDRDSVT